MFRKRINIHNVFRRGFDTKTKRKRSTTENYLSSRIKISLSFIFSKGNTCHERYRSTSLEREEVLVLPSEDLVEDFRENTIESVTLDSRVDLT